MFGPCIATNGVTWARNDTGLSRALTRLTKTREPGNVGYHHRLQCNQRLAFRMVADELEHLRSLYHSYFEEYTDKDTEIHLHHADPHEKRLARIHAWDELTQSGQRHYSEDCWLRGKYRERAYVTYKMKPEEVAKPPPKYSRGIGDMGCPASLAGYRLMEFLKVAMDAERVVVNDCLFVFCKSPKTTELQRHFAELHSPGYRFMLLYFSDDSVLAAWDDGQLRWYNLDISSCDASHTEVLFFMLRAILPDRLRVDFDVLYEQCRAPIRLRSTYSKSLRVLLRPLFAKLYSGSTVTTAINNMACLLIGFMLSRFERINPQTIRHAAELAGYVLTGTEGFTVFEEVQFLKHSPVWTGDHWHPVLNLGVLLRLSGVCKRDLPGRGLLLPRARAFQKSLLRGAYPRLSCTLVDSMKATVADAIEIPEIDAYIEKELAFKLEPDGDLVVVTDAALARRYSITGSELAAFSRLFGSMGFGDHLNHDVASRILARDYDLLCTELPVPSWDGCVFQPSAVR